ncbi:hypothetical protein GCM10025865_02530 [Paraoerskovia sediminicola]|uniref:BCCT, betaine/carnitine/choline family transporter n=2 Tax=Paraoerskovia sediminicola TaxID=1138587 RepID=A0ABN6X8A6_9CELL|nr:hypothetical protein GCM10025865_02530 [Paraoerskovia sediminicola]
MFTDDPIVGPEDAAAGTVDSNTALFDLIGSLPGGSIWVGLSIILIVLFFVTSSDSGSLVVDMLASGGDPNPPLWSRIFWAVLEGAVAAALLVSGGLLALQTTAILIALPFSVVAIGMMISVFKALRVEHSAIMRAQRKQAREAMAERVTQDVTEEFGEYFGVGSATAGPTWTHKQGLRRARGRGLRRGRGPPAAPVRPTATRVATADRRRDPSQAVPIRDLVLTARTKLITER